ncbi:MAG: TrmO family methyltransferase [Rhizomicrobium sp.]
MSVAPRSWQDPVTITPVGVVVSDFNDFTQPTNYDSESVIEFRPELTDALIGIEHFSHIHVLYYQHRRLEWQKAMGLSNTDEQVLTMPMSGEPSCKGIYTTRTPARPSGTGSCIVEYVSRDKNRLTVRGLDAFNGTSVLDIKIYIPRYDSFPMADAPLHWCARHDMGVTSRLLHWDTMNVGLTLGLRAGARALRELGISRGQASLATVHGGHFFAQGIEGTTGCSSLRHSMAFEDHSRTMSEWLLKLETSDGHSVSIQLHDRLYAGADEVLSLSDDILFSSVTLS